MRFLRGYGRRAGPHVPDLIGELMHENAVAERGLADVGAGTAVHGEPVASLAHDFDGALPGAGLLGEQGGEACGVRAADGDPGAEPGAGELGGLLVCDEPALLQRDDAVGGARGFLGVGSGVQDRAPLGGVRAQHGVQPTDLAGGEAVGGVVEHERVRVAEQGTGEAEAAVHAA